MTDRVHTDTAVCIGFPGFSIVDQHKNSQPRTRCGRELLPATNLQMHRNQGGRKRRERERERSRNQSLKRRERKARGVAVVGA